MRSTLAFQEILEEAQERLVRGLSDELLPDGRRRYVRNGTYVRRLVSKWGAVLLPVQRVWDRLEEKAWSPLLSGLHLGRRKYSPELRLYCAEEATRTSYGEAQQAIWRNHGVHVPRRTIWSFVQELAARVESIHRAMMPRVANGVHQADSTLVPSQGGGVTPRGTDRTFRSVHASIVQDPEDHRIQVAQVEVDGLPRRVLEGLSVERLVTDDDAAFTVLEVPHHQLCIQHFRRYVSFSLYKEGRYGEHARVTQRERDRWVKVLAEIMGHLKNSVMAHSRDRNWAALEHRVRETLSSLEIVADQLDERGYRRAATFIRTEAKATVVFAELAMRGIWIPPTNNAIERVMGMVSHRCKRAWARWGSGLRNLVILLLVRKTRSGVYETAVRRYMRAVGVA